MLIVGADRAGEALLRDLRRDSRYAVVGFVDDKGSLRGAKIGGHPVLGTSGSVARCGARGGRGHAADRACPARRRAQMRRVVALCDGTGLPYRTVPRLEDVVAGRAQFNEIKEVAIEDLLGRDAVELDWTAIRETLTGRRVLVTGRWRFDRFGAVPPGGAAGCAVADRGGAERIQPLSHQPRSCAPSIPELILDGVLADCGDRVAMQQAVRRAPAAGGVPCGRLQACAACCRASCARRFRNNVHGHAGGGRRRTRVRRRTASC